MNRRVRGPYARWCESLSLSAKAGRAGYSIIGWRSCLSWVTTIFMSSVSVICRVLFCLACCVGCFIFFLKRWKFFKNNFTFGSALQALLKTLVVSWLVRFLIVLANCVGLYVNTSLINFLIVRFSSLDAIGETLSRLSFQCIPSL